MSTAVSNYLTEDFLPRWGDQFEIATTKQDAFCADDSPKAIWARGSLQNPNLAVRNYFLSKSFQFLRNEVTSYVVSNLTFLMFGTFSAWDIR